MLKETDDKKLPSVTMLRGIASLMVCLVHFTGTIGPGLIKEAGTFGVYGVQIFFTISGFIIPYSLFQSGYLINYYHKFLLKRIVRIDPPYLIIIGVIILLSYAAQLSPYHTTEPIRVFTMNNLYHLFYLTEICHGKWLIHIFWTLAIEFQFYLLIGLIFPLLLQTKKYGREIVFGVLSILPFLLKDDRFVTDYIFYFLPGMAYFSFVSKQMNANKLFFWLMVFANCGYFKNGAAAVICPLLSIAFIHFINKPFKPLMFLGMISYSLYLVHTPLGTDSLIQFLQNYITSDTGRIWLMILSLPVVIGIAWVYYQLIEKRALTWSRKIFYKD